MLSNAVDLGLSHILAAVQSISASQRREGLTLACTHSFAHGWLLPRFSSQRRATGEMPINLVVSYWLKDIVVDEVDLIVNWRADAWTIGWESWFAQQGHLQATLGDSYLFSSYQFMLQAAMEGEGVGLGWHHLVADLIAENRLIKIGPAFTQPNSTYTLEYRQDRSSPERVTPVLEWFRNRAAELLPAN